MLSPILKSRLDIGPEGVEGDDAGLQKRDDFGPGILVHHVGAGLYGLDAGDKSAF